MAHERLLEQYADAYLTMAAQVRYRPAAPGDGMGGIYLTKEQLADPYRLAEEARQYAKQFLEEENGRRFYIGCAKWPRQRALVYVIEAARDLCAGGTIAAQLLQLAQKELRGAK